jgi:hypothetical protein
MHFKHLIVCVSLCERPCEQFHELRRQKPGMIEELLVAFAAKHPGKYQISYELCCIRGGGTAVATEKRFLALLDKGNPILGSESEILEKVRQGVKFQQIFQVGAEHEVVMKLIPVRPAANELKKPKPQGQKGGQAS